MDRRKNIQRKTLGSAATIPGHAIYQFSLQLWQMLHMLSSGATAPNGRSCVRPAQRIKLPTLTPRAAAPHLHPAPTASISPHFSPQKNGFSAGRL